MSTLSKILIQRVMTDSSYYNKFGQESRAASPAFFPSRA